MSPLRRVLVNSLVLTLAAAPLGAPAASAQFYDPALQSLDLQSDVARSARLRGMGGLVLVIPDRNNHLTLWDFAGSPLGAFAEDSTGTLDLRPSTGSGSGAHNRPSGLGERQDFAGRVTEIEFETFYRDHKSAAYGWAVQLLRGCAGPTTSSCSSISAPRDADLHGQFPHFAPASCATGCG
jgi:hypothetical protein